MWYRNKRNGTTYLLIVYVLCILRYSTGFLMMRFLGHPVYGVWETQCKKHSWAHLATFKQNEKSCERSEKAPRGASISIGPLGSLKFYFLKNSDHLLGPDMYDIDIRKDELLLPTHFLEVGHFLKVVLLVTKRTFDFCGKGLSDFVTLQERRNH